ncbi:MAG: hypothetical protein JOZ08_08975 [Verrucomicrobia bacterium]|nr:hypothetical protein [Verrucomicrobiota bacterium]
MKEPIQKVLRYIAIELVVYAILAIAYFCLVLQFLGTWLAELFHEQRIYYVVASVLLMTGQAIGLERLVTGLSHIIRSGKK